MQNCASDSRHFVRHPVADIRYASRAWAGLGKTAQVIALLAGLKVANKLGSVMVVCPATVMAHWLRYDGR